MFFLLSKTIGYLIKPLVVVWVFILLYFLIKNTLWKKRMLMTALLLFLVFSNRFVANEAIGLFEYPPIPIHQLSERKAPYRWGILLTGVTSSHKILKDRVYISGHADRVNHTVMLYHKGFISKILISGGTGKLINPAESEARALKDVFLYMGIPEEDLEIEGESRNTHESAVAVKKILKDEDYTQCLLITSSSHIPRALGCFKKEGMNCDVFPTDIQFNERDFTPDVMIVPDVDALDIWEEIFKEIAGLIAYRIAGYI